jgi:cytochrome c
MTKVLGVGLLLLTAVPLAGAGAPAGNVVAGERAFQKCYACHETAPGRNGLSGPTLYALLGRRIAAESGFDYSPALRALAKREERWTAALVGRFVADPEAVAPGTEMTFTGMRDPRERADLIAYLQTLRPREP